ncbi:TonB family C-terminal domain-containing protein [Microbulbifer yueqingensis]|uniref:TonB family C-terminal domain-containing protein n=2 Tax=Microbulbifer yueqingensis TaxID=658219 RepID=A0A1G8XS72_9GAMM|nr:TonB family C-terminal domain-containing protein [Microbulbifer yueqingensis]
MVFAAAVSANAAPLLNGLALEQQFNKDRYIAAVYSDTLADSASTLLDENTTRRLEIRVIADSLSARRLRNQWMEAIAINNSGSTLSAQADNMVTFANLLKGRLKRGDQLRVDFDGASGASTVSLNGIQLGRVQDRKFFTTLLRSWVGPVPPSTEFREGLLAAGNVDSGLLGRYELLEPSDARILQLTEAQQEEEEESKAEQDSEAVAQKPKPSKPKVAAAIPPPTLAAAGSTPQAPATSKPAPARSKPKSQAAASKPRPAAKEEAEPEEDDQPLTADMLLARQIYHSMLLRHTYEHISYPSRALQRNQEGSVQVRVTIDPAGEVRDVQTVRESRFSDLNKAAVSAIKAASPYPKVPPALAKSKYEFSVPITFRLPD